MSASNHDQGNQSQTEVPRGQPSLEELHRLLVSVSQNLANVTAEQHRVRVRMEEMAAERTAPPGFERLPQIRELLSGQTSRPIVFNTKAVRQPPPIQETIQPPPPQATYTPDPQVHWAPDSGPTYQPEPNIVWPQPQGLPTPVIPE